MSLYIQATSDRKNNRNIVLMFYNRMCGDFCTRQCLTDILLKEILKRLFVSSDFYSSRSDPIFPFNSLFPLTIYLE